MSTKVFISYRRDDSAGHAGRVHDRLEREFGRDLLFMDVDAVPLGRDFVKVLGDAVGKCDVLLAVIGPNWLNAKDEEGNRRIDNEHDFVRVEIAAALKRDIPVIPILFDGTSVPKAGQLPDDLKNVSRRNGLDVRHASFHSDMDKLVRGLRGTGLPPPPPEKSREDQLRAEGRIKVVAVGYPVMAALGTLVSWLTAARSPALGTALTALLSILGGVLALAASLIYGRYFGILGAGGNPEGSPERESYVRLRASLARGGIAGRLYVSRVKRFLDTVDDFFGDAGGAAGSLFPHAFGLKTPAPLWTPRAFDRCLFLALVYPIAAIFVIWAIAGQAGPAEVALGLNPNVPGLLRGFVALTAIFEGFILWSFFRRKARKSIVWGYVAGATGAGATATIAAVIALGVVAGAAALTFAFGSVGAGAFAFGVAMIAAVVNAGRVAGAASVAAAVPVLFGLAFGLGGAPASTVIVVVAVAAASTIAILLLCGIAIRYQAQGVFLFFFIPAAIMACLYTVELFLPLKTWPYFGPMLLFQGLLTLINAPFNWGSIGLTRALLRRGLELGGWWPYFLALMNVLLAAAIVAMLALAMVIATQAFNEVVARGGGAPILPLNQLFGGITKNPSASEYWWIYALLLATMSPSLINLVLGGASLIPGIPGLPTWLHDFMPEGKAVRAFDRTWLAVVLTLQNVLGAVLGIGAGAFLVVILSVYVMPHAGLSLLDQARAVADYDLPARVGQFLPSFR